MFHLVHPLIIYILFISPFHCDGSVGVGRSCGSFVRKEYIKRCTLPISSPETLSHNVQPCPLFPVCCPVRQLLLLMVADVVPLQHHGTPQLEGPQ